MSKHKNMSLDEAKKILTSEETRCFWENNGENPERERLGEAIHTVLAEFDRLSKLKENN